MIQWKPGVEIPLRPFRDARGRDRFRRSVASQGRREASRGPGSRRRCISSRWDSMRTSTGIGRASRRDGGFPGEAEGVRTVRCRCLLVRGRGLQGEPGRGCSQRRPLHDREGDFHGEAGDGAREVALSAAGDRAGTPGRPSPLANGRAGEGAVIRSAPEGGPHVPGADWMFAPDRCLPIQVRGCTLVAAACDARWMRRSSRGPSPCRAPSRGGGLDRPLVARWRDEVRSAAVDPDVPETNPS